MDNVAGGGIHWVHTAFDLSLKPKERSQIIVYVVEPSPNLYSKKMKDVLTTAGYQVMYVETKHQKCSWRCGYYSLHYGEQFLDVDSSLWSSLVSSELLTDLPDTVIQLPLWAAE